MGENDWHPVVNGTDQSVWTGGDNTKAGDVAAIGTSPDVVDACHIEEAGLKPGLKIRFRILMWISGMDKERGLIRFSPFVESICRDQTSSG